MLHKINQIGSYEFLKNYTRHEQNPQGIATTSFPLSSHHLPWLVSLEFLFCCSEHFICEIQESLLQDKLEYIRTSADAIFSTPSTKSAVLVHPFLMPPTSPGGGGEVLPHEKLWDAHWEIWINEANLGVHFEGKDTPHNENDGIILVMLW